MYKHILFLSLDAFDGRDFNIVRNKDAFSYLLRESTYSLNMESIYPSLTYPAHTTVMTGKLPKNHGVINNTLMQPGVNIPQWYWYRKYIFGETLYDLAIRKNKTVASFLWPVTGKSKIKYNLPEIFPTKWYQTQVGQVLSAGSPFFVLDLDKKFKHLRNGINQPQLDSFVHESAKYTFKKYHPFMTLIHYVELDFMKHYKGIKSKEYYDALDHYSEKVMEWINLLKSENLLEETLIVVFGDHSQKSTNFAIKPNVILHKNGFLKVEDKKLKSWNAYFKSSDGSGYVYLKDNKDMETKNKLISIFKDLSLNKENGIDRVIEKDEIEKLGADTNCAFMLEALDGFYFSEEISGNYLDEVSDENGLKAHHFFSSHGYDPRKMDYQSILMIKGKNVPKEKMVNNMKLIDIAPTVAKLMGESLQEVDGNIRLEFFNNK